jgi:hypothetical protein
MTVLGGLKTDATGRATGQRKTNAHTKIKGQFSPRPTAMMRSPAYQALSLAGHRVLSRIEIELANHGGMDNGKLPVTFKDFESYGIDRHAIAPAIRECIALGFIEQTVKGRSGVGEFRRASQFRLTFLHANARAATHEWEAIETIEEARAIALRSRDLRRAASSLDIDSSGEIPTERPRLYVVGNTHRTPLFSVGNTHRYSVGNTPLGSEFGRTQR